ncbi:MAG: hypothetical protein MUP17_09420 [candidate division Zixibacteria bacterium]|nr:hypothetical protein [candidate division Zixibacteria bacterium]
MSPTPYASKHRLWAVDKIAPYDGIMLDFKHRILRYNKVRFWIRFETQDKLWIWAMPLENPKMKPIEHWKYRARLEIMEEIQKHQEAIA